MKKCNLYLNKVRVVVKTILYVIDVNDPYLTSEVAIHNRFNIHGVELVKGDMYSYFRWNSRFSRAPDWKQQR